MTISVNYGIILAVIIHKNVLIFILCNTLTYTSFIKNFCYEEQILVDLVVLYIRSRLYKHMVNR